MKKSANTARSRHQALINIVLLIVSISVSFVVAEIIVRKVIPFDKGKSYDFRIPHPVLGWVLQPNAAYHNELPEETVYVKYNSRGFRDIEHNIEKPDGVFRILILGDSFMEAYSVNLDESFTRQLEKFAGKRGYNIETINLGVGGYGSLQEYLTFREHGKQYNPDIVLIGFYVANDVRNNSLELESIVSEPGPRPFLDPRQLDSWKIIRIDYDGAYRRYKEARNRLETLPYRLARHSILLTKLLAEYRRTVKKLSKNEEENSVPPDKVRKELSQFGIHYCEEPPEYSRAWDLTERIFSRLKKEVEAAGAKLVVFTVPALWETGLEEMKQVTANVTTPELLCLEEAPGYRRLGRMLKKLDIDYIDLLPDFRKAMQSDDIEFFRRSDRHWNKRGHSLAAKSVLKALIEKKLF